MSRQTASLAGIQREARLEGQAGPGPAGLVQVVYLYPKSYRMRFPE